MARPQPEYVDVTSYIVIEPKWSDRLFDDRNRPILEGGKVTRAAQSPPGKVLNGGIVTRVTFRVDASALLPLQPQAIVHIHADDVSVIEVTADAPESETH